MDEHDVSRLKDVLRTLVPGQETVLDLAREILPDGQASMRLTMEQRRVNPEPPEPPVKAPSPRRQHLFFNLAGFVAYLKKFGGDGTVILADAEAEEMHAILDERAPTGFEVLVFRPQVHPLFAPWAEILAPAGADAEDDEQAAAMPLKRFVEFLVANRRVIVEPPPHDLILTLSQVRVSRKIELCQGQGARSINGLMVETVIQGQQAKNNFVELPDRLRISVPLYIDTVVIVLEIDVSLSASEGTGIRVRLASADAALGRVETFERMLADAERALGEKYTIAMGRPDTAAWDILKSGC